MDLDAREGCSVPAELYSVPLSGEGVGAFVRPGGREWAFHITIAVTTMLLAVAHASSFFFDVWRSGHLAFASHTVTSGRGVHCEAEHDDMFTFTRMTWLR